MLSHLRFHRRGPSAPTSPSNDAAPTSPFSEPSNGLFGSSSLSQLGQSPVPLSRDSDMATPTARPRSSNSSSLPPTLPPITRVTSSASTASNPLDQLLSSPPPTHMRTSPSPPPVKPPSKSPSSGSREGKGSFIGGVALQYLQRDVESGRWQEGVDRDVGGDSSRPVPPSVHTVIPGPAGQSTQNLVIQQPILGSSSLVVPKDFHHTDSSSSTSSAPAGRRSAGLRIPPQPTAPLTVATGGPGGGINDAGLSKNSLSGFLKKPMSTLLMRRKTNHNVPDLSPLGYRRDRDRERDKVEDPTYDPRIRGTRIHDFSAPRPRRIVSGNDAPATAATSPGLLDAYAEAETLQEISQLQQPDKKIQLPSQAQAQVQTQLQSQYPTQHLQVLGQQHSHAQPSLQDSLESYLPDSSISQKPAGSALNIITRGLSFPEHPMGDILTDETHISADIKPTSELSFTQIVPHQPEDTTHDISLQSISSSASFVSTSEHLVSRAIPSIRSTRSNDSSKAHLDLAGHDTISAIPRHMKSTSSRFSFDMIGAAKQEKLLEERHRQRELERLATETTTSQDRRDSRFDDLEMDDGFDYDAVMDDDGLEERIPGVNADVEFDDDGFGGSDGGCLEDEGALTDPDNDQENFSGFVFQRSNPPSATVQAAPQSLGTVGTPRDAEGNVIGFALSKDSPGLEQHDFLFDSEENQLSQAGQNPDYLVGPIKQIPGLRIRRSETGSSEAHQPHLAPNNDEKTPLPVLGTAVDDEMYFNSGEFRGELENEFTRDSDAPAFDESIFDHHDTDQYGRPIPGAFARAQSQRAGESKRESGMSQVSAQSGLSHSTTHTSLSHSASHQSAPAGQATEASAGLKEIGDITKLSPPRDESGTYQAALAAAACQAAASGKFCRDDSSASSTPPSAHHLKYDGTYDDDDYPAYEEDDKCQLDDLNCDDGFDDEDDAIIAEANASALANDSDGWYSQEFNFHSTPTKKGYEFANGGFFGPPSLANASSGRAVSREPNLTPITERSEYSNRNSIMSLAVPQALGSAGGSGSSGGGLHSPGLAQLAMMGAESGPGSGDNVDMTLSALMRLRSRAWGGSQASLPSSGDGSPRSERADGASPPWGFPVSQRRGSAFSVVGLGGWAREREGAKDREKERERDKGTDKDTKDRRSMDGGSLACSPTLIMAPSLLGSPAPIGLGRETPFGPLMGPIPAHPSFFPMSPPPVPDRGEDRGFLSQQRPMMQHYRRSSDSMAAHHFRSLGKAISLRQELQAGETSGSMNGVGINNLMNEKGSGGG